MSLGSACRRLVDARGARATIAACGCAAVVWTIFLRGYRPADLLVFVRAGRAVAHGLSPYVDASSPSLWSGHAFVYPYLVAWCFAPLGALPLAAAGLVYYLGSVAALMATVRMLLGPGAGAMPVVLALTAEPVVRALQLGTLNVWLLFGLAVAWRYRDRAPLLVAALSAVVAAKLFLLPMLAWLVLTRRLRVAAVTAAVSGAAVVVGCILAELSIGSFARMLSVLSDHEAPHSSSITAVFQKLGADSGLAAALAALVAAGITALGWAQSRRRHNQAYLFCGCVLACIAASPIVWSHYFALLLLIPLTLGWRQRSQLLAWAVTWVMFVPGGAPALGVLHPFPGAGWIWGAIGVVSIIMWHHRRRSMPAASRPSKAATSDAGISATAGRSGRGIEILAADTPHLSVGTAHGELNRHSHIRVPAGAMNDSEARQDVTPSAQRLAVRRVRRLPVALSAVCPMLLIGLLLWHRSAIGTGAGALGRADDEWILVAAAAAAATWVAAACCQLGAITVSLPFVRVFAAQVASSFTNRVLPAGLGGAAVNLRMLRRAGLSRPDAASAIGLNAGAGVIVHLGALVVVLTLIPRSHQLDPGTRLGLIALMTAVLAGLAMLAWRPPARLARAPEPVRDVVAHVRAVLQRPGRAVLLWAGSAAIPTLHIVTLLAVMRSLDLPQPVTATTLAYLGASAVAALIPSPGGFGSLDLALVAALANLGTPAPNAIAAVLGYRLLTVWIPMLPGAATLALLLHRRLI